MPVIETNTTRKKLSCFELKIIMHANFFELFDFSLFFVVVFIVSENPLSVVAAQELRRLVAANPRLTALNLEGTLVPKAQVRRGPLFLNADANLFPGLGTQHPYTHST